MSNVQRLTKHMLSESWQDDLNYNNPLGMRGEIASSYAELVKNMWSGRNSSTMPRAFKVIIFNYKFYYLALWDFTFGVVFCLSV